MGGSIASNQTDIYSNSSTNVEYNDKFKCIVMLGLYYPGVFNTFLIGHKWYDPRLLCLIDAFVDKSNMQYISFDTIFASVEYQIYHWEHKIQNGRCVLRRGLDGCKSITISNISSPIEIECYGNSVLFNRYVSQPGQTEITIESEIFLDRLVFCSIELQILGNSNDLVIMAEMYCADRTELKKYWASFRTRSFNVECLIGAGTIVPRYPLKKMTPPELQSNA